MSTGDLPPWPKAPEHTERLRGISANGMTFPEAQKLLVLMYYERARADFWEARCREAVKALNKLNQHHESPDPHYSCAKLGFNATGDEPCTCHAKVAAEALSLIGDIPDERS
jgi:hypothetical protein